MTYEELINPNLNYDEPELVKQLFDKPLPNLNNIPLNFGVLNILYTKITISSYILKKQIDKKLSEKEKLRNGMVN